MNKIIKSLLAVASILSLSSCTNINPSVASTSSPSISEVKTTRYVYFESNGGTIYAPVIIADSSQVRLPTPTKNGYEFLGWYDNANFEGNVYQGIYTPTLETIIFYAKWASIQTVSTLSFDFGDIEDIICLTGDTITLPNPFRYGYRFDGWLVNGGGEPLTGTYLVTGSVNFVAKFTKVNYLYLYLNYSTENVRLEYEPNTVVKISDLETPADFNKNGGLCPFVKWVNEDNSDVNETITLTKDIYILKAEYDLSKGNPYYNLEEDDGSYYSTAKSVKVIHQADSVQGIFSLDVEVSKNGSGAAGVAFRMKESGNDYPFEDKGTYYISANLSPSGSLGICQVYDGDYSSIKTIKYDNMPQSFKDDYQRLNVSTANIKVYSDFNSFTIYVNNEAVYTSTDQTLLSKYPYTGFGFRASKAGYTLSNFVYDGGKVIKLDPNGGDPISDIHYWGDGKDIQLPVATTSTPNKIFEGWYYDSTCTQKVDTNNVVISSEDMTLYANYRYVTHEGVIKTNNTYKTTTDATAYLFDNNFTKFSVNADITFRKSDTGNVGLIIRTDIDADNAYGNCGTYIEFVFITNCGGFQIVKYGDEVSNIDMYSVTKGKEIPSPLKVLTGYFPASYISKYNSVSSGQEITVNLKIIDNNGFYEIYFDNVLAFEAEINTSDLPGNGIGVKSNHLNAQISNIVVEEIN